MRDMDGWQIVYIKSRRWWQFNFRSIHMAKYELYPSQFSEGIRL